MISSSSSHSQSPPAHIQNLGTNQTSTSNQNTTGILLENRRLDSEERFTGGALGGTQPPPYFPGAPSDTTNIFNRDIELWLNGFLDRFDQLTTKVFLGIYYSLIGEPIELGELEIENTNALNSILSLILQDEFQIVDNILLQDLLKDIQQMLVGELDSKSEFDIELATNLCRKWIEFHLTEYIFQHDLFLQGEKCEINSKFEENLKKEENPLTKYYWKVRKSALFRQYSEHLPVLFGRLVKDKLGLQIDDKTFSEQEEDIKAIFLDKFADLRDLQRALNQEWEEIEENEDALSSLRTVFSLISTSIEEIASNVDEVKDELVDIAVKKRWIFLLAWSLHERVVQDYQQDIFIFPIINNCLDIVILLLNKGANIEAKRDDGFRPLMIAAINGHIEMVRLLLSRGADVQAEWDDGSTSLMASILEGHVEMVKLLLDKKSNIEARGNDDTTPLILATHIGHIKVVRLLLGRKANIEAKRDDGFTPLMVAASEGHAEVVRLLLDRKANIETKLDDASTPLMAAASEGHVEAVRLLLDREADIEAKRDDGFTPLMIAVDRGHVEVVRLLLDRKANIEAKNNNDLTPLILAAFKGHVEVVRLLLNKGASIEAEAVDGFRPLMLAALAGNLAMVELLLDREADINAEDNNR